MIPGFLVGTDIYKERFRTEIYGKSLTLISFPPDWQCKLAGLAVALLSFLTVLLCLRGLLSLIVWVLSGFRSRDDKATKVPDWPYWSIFALSAQSMVIGSQGQNELAVTRYHLGKSHPHSVMLGLISKFVGIRPDHLCVAWYQPAFDVDSHLEIFCRKRFPSKMDSCASRTEVLNFTIYKAIGSDNHHRHFNSRSTMFTLFVKITQNGSLNSGMKLW